VGPRSTGIVIVGVVAVLAALATLYGIQGHQSAVGPGAPGERAATAPGDLWPTACLVINGVEAKLYVADTPQRQAEGYMYKDSIDFQRVGAVGMIFNISASPGSRVAFTMRNVAFPLYLLHISPVEGVGDVAVDIVYMEPGKEYYSVTVRSDRDYFIELGVEFYKQLERSPQHLGGYLIRVTGTC